MRFANKLFQLVLPFAAFPNKLGIPSRLPFARQRNLARNARLCCLANGKGEKMSKVGSSYASIIG